MPSMGCRGLVGSVLAILDEKPGFESQTRHQNEIPTKSISSAISSQQISGKNSESQIKIAMKSFSKNLLFGVDFKL